MLDFFHIEAYHVSYEQRTRAQSYIDLVLYEREEGVQDETSDAESLAETIMDIVNNPGGSFGGDR